MPDIIYGEAWKSLEFDWVAEKTIRHAFVLKALIEARGQDIPDDLDIPEGRLAHNNIMGSAFLLSGEEESNQLDTEDSKEGDND
jgi:hypothetical protein